MRLAALTELTTSRIETPGIQQCRVEVDVDLRIFPPSGGSGDVGDLLDLRCNGICGQVVQSRSSRSSLQTVTKRIFRE
jgi:hypothetical protein